jgi:hypothetical protein
MKYPTWPGSLSQTTVAKETVTKPLTAQVLIETVAKMQSDKRIQETFDAQMRMMVDRMRLLYGPMPIYTHRDFNKKICPSEYRIGVDVAKGVDKSSIMVLGSDGECRAIIGNLGEDKMAYDQGCDEGYDAGMKACEEGPARRKKELSPVIATLVNYAERTGMAEANLQNVRGTRRELENKVEDLTCELRRTTSKLGDYQRAYEELDARHREQAKVVQHYQNKEYRAKQLAAKKRAAAKKKTTKKSK